MKFCLNLLSNLINEFYIWECCYNVNIDVFLWRLKIFMSCVLITFFLLIIDIDIS